MNEKSIPFIWSRKSEEEADVSKMSAFKKHVCSKFNSRRRMNHWENLIDKRWPKNWFYKHRRKGRSERITIELNLN